MRRSARATAKKNADFTYKELFESGRDDDEDSTPDMCSVSSSGEDESDSDSDSESESEPEPPPDALDAVSQPVSQPTN